MSLSIQSIKKPSTQEWDTIWQECDYATYYHSRHWAELWQAYAPEKHKPVPELVLFSDGARALIPLTRTLHTRGLHQIHESGPYNTYGGWISLDALTENHHALLRDHMLAIPNLVWMTNPYAPEQGQDVLGEATHTRAMHLDSENVSISGRAARYLRALQRSGVAFRQVTEDDHSMLAEAYQENQRRWNDRKQVFHPRMIPLLHGLPRCDFIGAFDDKGLLCAAAVMRSKHHIAGWFSVAFDRAYERHAGEALQVWLINRYRDAGYHWYDLHPSGNRPGIDRYKEKLGAESLPLRIIRRPSMSYRLVQGLRTMVGTEREVG